MGKMIWLNIRSAKGRTAVSLETDPEGGAVWQSNRKVRDNGKQSIGQW